ncbi:hypothetical protein HY485_01970 [Candidatus Woesearchaeota archaeon]|nr:hypothetical protein [Candidatus Woesearchaeota archaeon]
MITKETTDKIIDFIRQKPRTVQEIAHLLQKNWRTADRYVDIITTETGLISTRTFREGTRGALKVVFWNALDHAQGSAYQERLLQKILNGRHKEDFSPFDIYQFIPPKKREAYIEKNEYPTNKNINNRILVKKAQQQVLYLSGNLSWLDKQPEMIHVLEELSKKKVSIKILTRVDVTSQEKAKQLLAINKRTGWDAIQIRHCEQPLRAMIVDENVTSIKEVMTPQHHRELEKNTFIFYRIEDEHWISWLQKIFWHLWGQSVDATTRIEAIKTIKETKITEILKLNFSKKHQANHDGS